jgi:3',5'-cyclic AMP phosphodiesterase CpdA
MMPRLKHSRPTSRAQRLLLRCAFILSLVLVGCTKGSTAQPVDLTTNIAVPFRFVAYGDTRFHDPKDMDAANPPVRSALAQAIAAANPAFIAFTGDIIYTGDDANDWKTFESETASWHEKKIPVFPALGNHEFHGNEKIALANYFHHFPDLENSRYYSVRAANALLLILDSSVPEVSGPQGEWLNRKLASIPSDIDFVFLMLHHPPYTSSSTSMLAEGHAARSDEKALARLLEDHQPTTRARFIVFSGHVHNYERHEHGGVTYFVSGGGGAHAYPIPRAPDDPYQSNEINYHYLLVEVDRQQLKVTMNRLQLVNGKAVWTQPDAVKITSPAQAAKAASQ